MSSIYSFGIGTGTKNNKGNWLEVFYPAPQLGLSDAALKAVVEALDYSGDNQTIELSNTKAQALAVSLNAAGEFPLATIAEKLAYSNAPLVVTILARDEKPVSVPEVYLKLHLLSHRLVKPRQQKLDGMFAILPNVAWTNQGAIDVAELAERQLQARLEGIVLDVQSVDKFPKMTNYVVPTGTRIADTARVRLGAYLGEGTTIMHEGFCNFNAGTEGPAMVEGRISAGVFVGRHSDLGGGCSTMGTLSGGNNVIISIGEECLIGANAGVGIPLGDRCTVEAGLYITAGSVVQLIDADKKPAGTVKARDLAGKSDLLFRRNSTNGAIEVLTNQSAIELNHALHAHN